MRWWPSSIGRQGQPLGCQVAEDPSCVPIVCRISSVSMMSIIDRLDPSYSTGLDQYLRRSEEPLYSLDTFWLISLKPSSLNSSSHLLSRLIFLLKKWLPYCYRTSIDIFCIVPMTVEKCEQSQEGDSGNGYFTTDLNNHCWLICTGHTQSFLGKLFRRPSASGRAWQPWWGISE